MSYTIFTVIMLLTLTKILANNTTRSAIISAVNVRAFEVSTANKMCNVGEKLLEKKLAPPLTNEKHKGQAGRIGIFGGSLEYTGELKTTIPRFIIHFEEKGNESTSSASHFSFC